MRVTACALSLWLAAACAGCSTWRAPVEPPRGALFTQFRAPLTADVSGVQAGAKTGTASTMYVRDILITNQVIGWDDASIEKAARNGGLTRVDYADYEILEVLGIFGQFTTRVHGE